jgi:hypothetical protein
MAHIGPIDSKELVRLLQGYYQGGKHVDDPAAEYKEIGTFSIVFKEEENEHWRRACVYGKIVRIEKRPQHRVATLEATNGISVVAAVDMNENNFLLEAFGDACPFNDRFEPEDLTNSSGLLLDSNIRLESSVIHWHPERSRARTINHASTSLFGAPTFQSMINLQVLFIIGQRGQTT